MKNEGVCKGCTYRNPGTAYCTELRNTCNYCSVTGKSRLMKNVQTEWRAEMIFVSAIKQKREQR